MDFEQQLKDLPDLFFKETMSSKNTDLPETIEKFWESFYLLNLRNNTFDEDGLRVCLTSRIRSFTEVYQIIKSKYEISFSDFLDSFLDAEVFAGMGKVICACKQVMKVTFYSTCNYEEADYIEEKGVDVFENLKLVFKPENYYTARPFSEFSEEEKYVYYLIKEKAKTKNNEY